VWRRSQILSVANLGSDQETQSSFSDNSLPASTRPVTNRSEVGGDGERRMLRSACAILSCIRGHARAIPLNQ
jgi:hypothetical protein